MQSPDRCPICNAPEISADTPRTVYACGSSDYDRRPGTLRPECASKKAHATKTDIIILLVFVAIWLAVSQRSILNAIAELRVELLQPKAPETIEL